MSITYQQEFLSMCQDEVIPLTKDEWLESGHPTKELKIDWEAYYNIEYHGKLRFFTARDGKKLVGYFVVILTNPLTCKDTLMAYYDSVYVAKSHRKSMVGRRLFKFVEACLKEDGVDSVVASSSKLNPIGNFLSRLGYNEIETKYEKVL